MDRVLALFKEVSCHKPEEIPKLVKKLEQQLQTLKGQDLVSLDHEELCKLSSLGSNAYFKALTSAKLARATHKVIKCFPKFCEDKLQKDLEIQLERLLTSSDISDLKTLSLLLEQNQDAKSFAKANFDGLSKILHVLLCKDLLSLPEQDAKENMHCGAKLCIQTLQLCKPNMQQLLEVWPSTTHDSCTGAASISGDSFKFWKEIILTLISQLTQIITTLPNLFKSVQSPQNFTRDYLLLVGTALAMIFNCAPSFQIVVTSFMDLTSLMAQERDRFEFCGVQYSQDAAPQKNTYLPVTAVIKGLLVSCNKTNLKSGTHPLVFQVFPHVLKMCKGPTSQHYLSFQVLSLWCQKLAELGALRPSEDCLRLLAHCLNIKNPICSSTQPGQNEQRIHIAQNPSKDSKIKEDTQNITLSEDSQKSLDNFGHLSYMSANCPILSTTLDCIWLNWDSPVEGVAEYVLEIFRRLLNIWRGCVGDGTSSYGNLCEEMFEKVVSMAWYSKTRYKPLSLLIPHIDCENDIASHPRLKEELLMCMKFNHLASVASDIYKAFLLQLVSKSETKEIAVKIWEATWMPILVKGLTSEHVLQRMKVSTYWLEPTLNGLTGSRDLLLSSLEKNLTTTKDQNASRDHDLVLYAWTVTSRVARENFHSCCQLQGENLLRVALSSDDDLIKAEAFHLLASTLKKSEPLSELEIELLKEFVPFNLRTDSASFRHNLSSSVRKAIVRVRDSCLSCLKAQATDSSVLKQGLAFVDWLYELLMLSLAPGSSYQRRQTTFDLLFALLETLMYQEESTARKGKAHESADTLVRYAQKHGVWNFFSGPSFLTILYCLEDGVEEIQKESYRLLTTYFKWPKEMDYNTSLQDTDLSSQDSLHLVSKSSFAQQLMNRAFYLINRPRAFENHSGLLLLSLVLDKYIIGHNMVVTTHQTQAQTFLLGPPESVLKGKAREGKVSIDPALNLLDLLIKDVENSLHAVTTNIATQVKLHPIHGILQCINKCQVSISEHMKIDCHGSQGWHSKLENVIKLNYKVIDLILDVLAGGKSIADCPSFADIGSALEHLVSADEEQTEETTTLSPEFQLLLSWCWINLKESCSCLAGVTASSLLSNKKSCLDKAIFQGIGDQFIKVLTTCRHRGAIEGCRSGLYQFSLSLMSSIIEELVHIPRSILKKVLDSLSDNCLTSSVTRRSAGLPIIVQTVLQAACKCGDFVLLESTVQELYAFAAEPLPETHNQQHDLRQSHALNILKALFCDASLAPRLMSLLSKMVILVIEGFDSPSWAIRNAATQLISTLVTRIFGQRSKIDSAGSLNLEEFAALYPDVLSFLCSKLNTYITSAATLVRPSLYVMLTVLANIGPVPKHQFSARYSSSRVFLQRAAEFFLGSPMYSLRKLAGQVWVSLSALDEPESTLQLILQNVRSIRNNLNLLHGWMLCAHGLFASGHKSSSTFLLLINFCMTNTWVTKGCTSCLLIAAVVMQTVQLVLSQVKEIKQYLNELWSLTENCLNSACAESTTLQVGKRQCLRHCVETLQALCETSKDPSYEMKFQTILEQGLTTNDLELQTEILECLYEGLRKNSLTIGHSVQRLLFGKMLHQSHASTYIKTVDVLLLLRLKNQLEHKIANTERLEQILSELHNTDTPCLRKATFDLEGIVIGISSDERLLERIGKGMRNLVFIRLGAITTWCHQLVQFSCPTANEILRLSAASSLRTCGARLIDFCDAHRKFEFVEACLVHIVRSIVTLLEDTEDDVRGGVSIFISGLCNQAKMHYSMAYSTFSEWVAERLYWCHGLCSFLFGILYKQGSINRAVTSALNSEPGALFEAETSSAMSEEHILIIWAFVTLKRITLKHPEVCPEKLRAVASEASLDLSSVMPLISENLNGAHIFNISADENVLSVFLGIILLSNLCDSLPASIEGSRIAPSINQLKTSVSTLCQVQSLHQLLHKEYTDDRLLVCNLLDSKAIIH